MATIKLKNGSGAPLASDLVQGEPALDLTNKRLYTEDSGGAVIEVGVNPTELNVTNNITLGGTVDGRDIATDGTKLDGIEAGADVTDTANVTAAGALMDSELTSEASVKALDQGVATTDSPTFAGLGTTGNVTFGDNDKAIFGAGSDLQIYHDGSNSYIDDAGTGSLSIRGSRVDIGKYTGEIAIKAVADAEVELRYNNSAKLATTSTGIDVTGDMSLTDATPTINLYDSDDSTRTTLSNNAGISYLTPYGSTSGTYGAFILSSHDHTTSKEVLRADNTNIQFKTDGTLRGRFLSNGDYALYNDAGTSQDFFWDASTSRLGLGTTSPSSTLEVSGTSAGGEVEGLRLTNSSTTTNTSSSIIFNLSTASADSAKIAAIRTNSPTSSDTELAFSQLRNGTLTERMRIDSEGNVGIGTASPGYLVDAQSSGDAAIRIQSTGTGSSDDSLLRLQIAGTTASNLIAFGDSGNTFAGSIRYVHQYDYMRFDTNASERMRIGSGGDVRIGKTSSGIGTVGHEFGPTGYTYHTRDGGTILDLNRLTSDGKIVKFYKDGTEVGSISVTGSATTYNTSSDQRLKDNIVDAPSASDDIDAIQIRSFDWKADGSHQKYGMIAQELQTVAPDAVTEGDTEEDMMSVDYSKLVPMLVKEIQSLRARVAQLEGAN